MVRDLIQLTKLPITSAVTLTTSLGFLVTARTLDLRLLPVLSGVLLLACGSAAFNQVQEAQYDKRMERTRRRPIPEGHLSMRGAAAIATAMSIFGAAILLVWSTQAAFVLGLLTMFWYNAIYTLLKRFTAFAVVPGSLVGALPPLIGSAAAGGTLASPGALLLAVFLFVWQIPHFWLLLMLHSEDYEAAGLPTLTQILSQAQLGRVTFAWIVCAAAAGLLFPASGMLRNPLLGGLLTSAALLLLWQARALLHRPNERRVYAMLFACINGYGLLVMVLVAAAALQ